jgi:5-methylcytosine-specific restriction endonuclease McrA
MTDTGAARPWAAIAKDVLDCRCVESAAHEHVDAVEFTRFDECGQALAATERSMSVDDFEAFLEEDCRYGGGWALVTPLICGWRLWKAGLRTWADRVEYLAQADSCAECGTTEHLVLHHVIQRPPLEWLAADSIFVLCDSCHAKTHGGDL